MSESTGVLRPAAASGGRRHDLDALRAFAMLLGIALHGALSFVDFPWVVRDPSREPMLGWLVLAIHGFRMPLFFMLSGFFAAMLLRRHGLGGLLRHRARRIALPLLLSSLTLLPVTWIVMGWAASRPAPATDTGADSGRDIWTAAALGNLEAVRAHVARGASLDTAEPLYGHSPLGWAVIGDQGAVVDWLLASGADPNAPYRDENTALHTAAFFGREEAARRLLEAGADVDARNAHGETPLDTLRHDQATTELVASLLQVPVHFPTVTAGRDRVREMLASRGAASGLNDPSGAAVSDGSRERLDRLMHVPVFQHLWFLWFLCWLVAGFALLTLVVRRLPTVRVPSVLMTMPLCLLWLVPVTLVTQSSMHSGGMLPGFGPDDSLGLVPIPHVLAHHAIFFLFGALMFGVAGASERLGRGWWFQLPLALALAPVALGLSLHAPWARDLVGDDTARRLAADLGQVLFTWLMIFGLMGLAGRLLRRERRVVRYVSDSSYWLYLAHVPLIVWCQVLASRLDLPAMVKLSLVVSTAFLVLLASYQLLVRHTWIGRLLNGPPGTRRAPRAAVAPETEPASAGG